MSKQLKATQGTRMAVSAGGTGARQERLGGNRAGWTQGGRADWSGRVAAVEVGVLAVGL